MSNKMKIYAQEIKDGLQDALINNKISLACDFFSKDDFTHNKQSNKLIKTLAKANPNQKDLFYKHSILASVGWNANDDVFDKIETWNARNTPVDKQMNFMHNELDIIGHSTQSSVYDSDNNLIPDDTPIENLPDKFDVITEFVLYQMWDDEARAAMMQKLIAEINDGKWFVSMECRFPTFDYALIDKDGNHKTVARNDNTAFLTKHLKSYGGTGEYEGYKVGRLLKNFFFSGQGIVNKPANPRSIIFNNAVSFNSQGSLNIEGKNKMEDELKKQIASLQAELNQVKADKAKDDEEEMEDAKEKAKCALAKQDELTAQVAKLEASIQEKDGVIASLTEELKASNDKLSASVVELQSMKQEKVVAGRIAKLASAGLSDDEAKATVSKWSSLNDAQFEDIVAVYAAKAQVSTEKVVETAKANLEEAVVEKTANLNTNPVNKKAEELKTVANFLLGALPFSAKAQKN